MIIDFHTHSFLPNHVAHRAIDAMARAVKAVLRPIGDGTLANQIAQMAHDGIDKAIMLPIATKPAQFDVIVRNAEAIRSGAHGERAQRMIVPFVSVHPDDSKLHEHIEEVAKGGWKGIKLHPYYQSFSLDDPRVWPMFEHIASLGLVVQCHCGYDVGYPTRHDACGPKEIVSLMRHVPNLKFVAAHLGGAAGFAPHATDELMDMGCYADTSALAYDWMRDEQMRLLRSWPKERLLFATDFPWVVFAEAVRWVKSVRVKDDWDDIFCNNAQRLLN